MRIGTMGAGCILIGVLAGGCSRTLSDEPARADRIERTRVALEVVLVPEAAAREAARYVDMCDATPSDMLYVNAQLAWDPDGPELFESLDEAHSSPSLGSTGIPLAALACTEAGHAKVRGLQNV